MRARTSVVAMAVGGALALAPAAGADTVTLGSTAGTPSQTVCAGTVECTYLPFNNVYSPSLVVPFDGTITSFAINSGSTGGTVSLRILRPAAGGRFTGAGTSAPVTIAVGVQSAATSLPVRTGDLIGLENNSGAILFDTGTLTTFTAYYQLPALGDGASAAPNNISKDRRLLLSAVLTYTPPTGGGGSSPSGGGNVPGTPIVAQCIVPKLRNLTLAKATKALSAANCKLGKVTRVRDKRFKRGRVISQTPGAKWRRDVGAKVAVKVSLGPPKKPR
jgi:PASTA domain